MLPSFPVLFTMRAFRCCTPSAAMPQTNSRSGSIPTGISTDGIALNKTPSASLPLVLLDNVRARETIVVDPDPESMYADLSTPSMVRLYREIRNACPWMTSFVDYGSGLGYVCIAFGLLGVHEIHGAEMIKARHSAAMAAADEVFAKDGWACGPEGTWTYGENESRMVRLHHGRAANVLPESADVVFAFDARIGHSGREELAAYVKRNTLVSHVFVSTCGADVWSKHGLFLQEQKRLVLRTSGGEKFEFFIYLVVKRRRVG